MEKAHVSELKDQLNNNAAETAIAKQKEAQVALEREEERELERLRYENMLCRLRNLESALTNQ